MRFRLRFKQMVHVFLHLPFIGTGLKKIRHANSMGARDIAGILSSFKKRERVLPSHGKHTAVELF